MFLLCSSNIRFIRLLIFAAMMKSADNRGQSDIFDVEQEMLRESHFMKELANRRGALKTLPGNVKKVTSIIN